MNFSQALLVVFISIVSSNVVAAQNLDESLPGVWEIDFAAWSKQTGDEIRSLEMNSQMLGMPLSICFESEGRCTIEFKFGDVPGKYQIKKLDEDSASINFSSTKNDYRNDYRLALRTVFVNDGLEIDWSDRSLKRQNVPFTRRKQDDLKGLPKKLLGKWKPDDTQTRSLWEKLLSDGEITGHDVSNYRTALIELDSFTFTPNRVFFDGTKLRHNNHGTHHRTKICLSSDGDDDRVTIAKAVTGDICGTAEFLSDDVIQLRRSYSCPVIMRRANADSDFHVRELRVEGPSQDYLIPLEDGGETSTSIEIKSGGQIRVVSTHVESGSAPFTQIAEHDSFGEFLQNDNVLVGRTKPGRTEIDWPKKPKSKGTIGVPLELQSFPAPLNTVPPPVASDPIDIKSATEKTLDEVSTLLQDLVRRQRRFEVRDIRIAGPNDITYIFPVDGQSNTEIEIQWDGPIRVTDLSVPHRVDGTIYFRSFTEFLENDRLLVGRIDPGDETIRWPKKMRPIRMYEKGFSPKELNRRIMKIEQLLEELKKRN